MCAGRPDAGIHGTSTRVRALPDFHCTTGENGELVVLEGRHRAIGAAHGDEVPEALGGVPDQPGVLDYAFHEPGGFGPASSEGLSPVGELKIDDKVRDVATPEAAAEAQQKRFGMNRKRNWWDF